MTRLSRLERMDLRKFRHLRVLACASLFVGSIAALGGPSCVITANPDFAPPKMTPPFLQKLVPAPYQIQALPTLGTGYQSSSITFLVSSEDLQSPGLQALLLLDFPGFGTDYRLPALAQASIPPGHLDDPPRAPPGGSMTFTPPPTVSKGCHSVTLVVTHEFDADSQFKLRIKPKDDLDVATATWWYALGRDPADGLDLGSCLGAAPDGGADAAEAAP